MKLSETSGLQNRESVRKVFTVSEINHDIRLLLEKQFASVWMEGEISNLKRHSSGHIYLSLKDDKAQISAVFFSRYNQMLKFEVKDGLQVLVLGKISLYEPRGQYQFFIERIEPKGMGALQLAFLQLREKLEKEGLFDPARKKRIPKFPRAVGVVTSPTGAAIRDILNVMTRRFAGTAVLVNPVQVQGEGAAQQIARAIREMNALGGLDVLIVGRGGGSLEDLWAFNEEVVARAIADSKIPVISAVGHEIDWTISDLVADLRAPTPSAAAELVVQNREDLEKRLWDLKAGLRLAMTTNLRDHQRSLKELEQSYAFKQPLTLIQNFSQKMDELLRQLQNYLKSCVSERTHRFQNLAGKLHALSPLQILERGYSITFLAGGRPLKDLKSVAVGDSLVTRVWKGSLRSTVTGIEPSEGETNGRD